MGVYAYEKEKEPIEKRGSASEEFVTTDEPQPSRRPRRATRAPGRPTATTSRAQHISPYDHRPPYRRLWKIDAHDTLEFPPTVGYGHVYLAQQKGLFFALDAKTGKVDWRKSLDRCAASSPTIGKGVVYQSYMHPVQCPQDQAGADRLRRRLGRGHRPRALALQDGADRVVAAAAERAPVRRHLGPQGLRARRRHRPADLELPGRRPGQHLGGLLARAHLHRLRRRHALRAQRAHRAGCCWSAQSQSKFGSREFFYATPTVAYGRVYIGNTDGTMYVFGAKSGKLLWARPLGTYIYGARGGLQAARVRGHLRRQVLRARRGHRRHDLAGRAPTARCTRRRR